MSSLQKILVFGASLFFLLIYFGFDTKTKEHATIEKSRALSGEQTDINTLLKTAKPTLSPEYAARILQLEQQLETSAVDSMRISTLKKISGAWYDANRADIAGYYAEEVANLTESDEAWSIAATTYALGARQAQEDKVRKYCEGRVVKAFENAISLSPNNVRHKVNLALTFVERPPQNNPMKGILMLVDLNKKNPDNTMVLFHLGRLSIQTGQYAKAVERLERVVALEPENKEAGCLLAQALEETGDQQRAEIFREKCAS